MKNHIKIVEQKKEQEINKKKRLLSQRRRQNQIRIKKQHSHQKIKKIFHKNKFINNSKVNLQILQTIYQIVRSQNNNLMIQSYDQCNISIIHYYISIIQMSAMKLKDYQLIEQVGSGTFATVYKAKNKQGKVFAIKKMRQMPRNDEKAVMNQITLLKSINHKNIIHFETDFKQNGKWYLVFEFCGKGDLQRYKSKQGKIPQAFIKNIFYNIVEAVSVLHNQNIVHRDLKLANILINDEFQIKLADFGFSKDSESQLMTSFCGTPLTMAPQILQRKPYDNRCDTWSLGVLLYQLIYGKPPFYPSKQFGTGIIGLTNAVIKSIPVFHDGYDLSFDCKDIILKCLEKNAKARPTAQQLKSHKWFTSGIKSNIRRQYLQQSMSDDNDASNRAKSVLSQSITENLKQLMQEVLLTDFSVKQNLKLICKYYPQDQKLQSLYLFKITEALAQLSQSCFYLKLQEGEYKIPMKQIRKFQTHMENLKQFLSSEIKKRKIISGSLNLDKQIIKFVTKQFSNYVNSEEQDPEKIKLIYDLSKIPLKKIDYVALTINWSFGEEEELMKKPFLNYMKKQNLQSIIEHINDEHHEKEDVRKNWLIEKNIQNKNISAIEHNLGTIIKRVIEINNTGLKEEKI